MGSIIGKGMDIAQMDMANRQYNKNADRNVKRQKGLMDYQQELAMENWENTNYKAQRDQMTKAGLNIGLMYGGGGAGGGTTGGGSIASSPTGAEFTTNENMQTMMQMELMKAQKENIDADTNLKGVQAGKTSEETRSLGVGIKNQETQNELMQIDKDLKSIELNFNQQTFNSSIEKYEAEVNKLIGEAESAVTKGEIDMETRDDQIKIIKQEAINRVLEGSVKEAGLRLTDAQIKKISNDIVNDNIRTQNDTNRVDIEALKAKLQEEYPSIMNLTGGMGMKILDAILGIGGKTMYPTNRR